MQKDNENFDFQKALKALQSGKPLTGKYGILSHFENVVCEIPICFDKALADNASDPVIF